MPFYDHHKSRLVETMTFWAEYHGGFKGFSPNEFFEWEDSHPLCSNAPGPCGGVMITITITITRFRYKIRIPIRRVGTKSEPILAGIYTSFYESYLGFWYRKLL